MSRSKGAMRWGRKGQNIQDARKRRHRRSFVESLEPRLMLAAFWQNPCNPADVNDDGFVTPMDALLSLNAMNRGGARSLPVSAAGSHPSPPFVDASGDGFLSPLDPLVVINHLNRRDDNLKKGDPLRSKLPRSADSEGYSCVTSLAEPVNAATDKALRLSEFVLFAHKDVELGKNSRIDGGLVGSNRDVHIQKDSIVQEVAGDGDLKLEKSARVGGDLIFNGKVDIAKQSLVEGDVHSGEQIRIDQLTTIKGDVVSAGRVQLSENVTVEGTVTSWGTPESFSTLVLPAATSFTTDPDRDIKTGKKKNIALAPGAYGDLMLGQQNMIQLSAGEYYFDRIQAAKELTLNLNVSAGAVAIFVSGSVSFDKNLDVNMIGGGPEDVYLETHREFRMDKDSEWLGTIYAPFKKVELHQNLQLTGAVYSGDTITLHKGNRLNHVPARRLLPLLDGTAPVIMVGLANDTGSSDTDGYTADAFFSGTVSDDLSGVTALTASVNSGPSVAVAFGAATGAFTFDPQLTDDGEHTVSFTATDAAGNAATSDVTFTLDTAVSAPFGLGLIGGNDTGTSAADGITNNASPLVGGDAETGATVELFVDGNSAGKTTAGSPWQIATGSLFQGTYEITATAEDRAGNLSGPSEPLAITVDLTPPEVAIEFPADGMTVNANVTIGGNASDALTDVDFLEARIDGGSFFDVPLAPDGSFQFDTELPLDGSADGSHTADVRATDLAGNVALSSVTFTLETAAGLIEGSDFVVAHQQTITVPNDPSTLRVSYSDLLFDTSDTFVNDAFEVALLDARGQSLVHTIAPSRDAALNITEGHAPLLGANTQHSAGLVEIDLAHIPPGTEATLVARLVNNDRDTTSRVTISDVETVAGSLGTPRGTMLVASVSTAALIDTGSLSDVTASMSFQFGATSFNAQSDRLFADVAVESVGTLSAAAPLLVVVEQVSDPSVVPLHPAGRTADGKPYYDFTQLVSGGRLGPGQQTGFGALAFSNPNGVQFDFELTVLGQLNRTPEVTSSPPLEALVDKLYSYSPHVDDADDDAIAFSLVAAPGGMTVDAGSGVIQWTPAAADEGTHTIVLRVNDGHGGTTDQAFTLQVRDNVPNRPPLFTSDPPVDATVAAFFEVVDVPVGGNPVAVAVGDFTGFGPTSLVAANRGDQTVSFVEGLGRQRFVEHVPQSVGELPEDPDRLFMESIVVPVGFTSLLGRNHVLGMVASDFDGDGNQDLLALRHAWVSTTELIRLHGRGDGTFDDPVVVTNTDGRALTTLLLADLDQDGVDDLIGTAGAQEIFVYNGLGGGDFDVPQILVPGGRVHRLVTADVDHDGAIDILSVSAADDSFSLFLNDGNAAFGPPLHLATEDVPLDLLTGDFDNDRKLDVMILTPHRGIQFFGGNGDGTFREAVLSGPFRFYYEGSSGVIPEGGYALDANGDGLLDVVAAENPGRGRISVLLGDGTGALRPDSTTEPPPEDPVLNRPHGLVPPQDLNGDGRLDLIFHNEGRQSFAVAYADNNGRFQTVQYIASPESEFGELQPRWGATPHSVVLADFNNDGLPDGATSFRQQDSRRAGGITVTLAENPNRFLAPERLYRAVQGMRSFGEGDALALADANEDGLVDILTKGAHAGWLEGLGGGAFADGQSSSSNRTGTGFSGQLRTGDFNSDGHIDLLIEGHGGIQGHTRTGAIITFGLGNGLFTENTVYDSRGIDDSRVADVNNDGFDDFVLVSSDFGVQRTVDVWLFDASNPEARNFTRVQNSVLFNATVAAGALSIADVDSDGTLDLLLISDRRDDSGAIIPEIRFLAGNGDGTFDVDTPTVSPIGRQSVVDMEVADLDGDGRVDVVAVTHNSTHVLFGNGDQTFGSELVFSLGTEDVEVVDVDRDGLLDIVLAGGAVYFGRGGRAFSDAVTHAGLGLAVELGDLDNDARLDWVDSDAWQSNAYYGGFAVFRSQKPGLSAVETADVNRDGRLDILAANQATGHVKLLLGGGNNTFQRQHDILVGRGPAAMVTSDFNEDGLLDFVTANEYDHTISMMMGTAGGRFTRTDMAAGEKPTGLAVGDLTGDGLPDVVVVNATGQSATFYANQGDGTLATGVEIPLGDEPYRVAIGDVTGDRSGDIVLTNPASARVTILPGRNDGTFDAPIFASVGGGAGDLAIGDLNEDGRDEIVVTGPDGNVVRVLYNRGGGNFSRPQEIRVGAGPTDVRLQDVDRDGRLDLVVAGSEGDVVSVVYNRFDEDRLYVYQATATDPDGDSLSFTLVDGPGGMLLDEQTGEITWAPTADQAGPNGVTLEVSDGRGGTATQRFVIHVSGRADNSAPLLTSDPATTLSVTQLYEGHTRAADGDGDQLHYTLVSGPEGMTVGDLDGRITWDPRSRGVAFDGTNDYVAVPDSPSLQPDSFTLETWIRFDAIDSYMLLSKAVGGTHSFRMDFARARFLSGRVGGATGGFTVSTPFDPEIGRWYHVAFTYEPVNGTQELQLFIDGALQNRETRTAAILTYDESPILIGQNAGGFGNFPGAMDEVRIWSRARTEAEIATDIHRVLAGNESGLVGYYRFEEEDFLVVRDSSSSGNDGTRGDGKHTDGFPKRADGVTLVGSHDIALRVDDRQGGVVDHSFTIDILPQLGGDVAGSVFNAEATQERFLRFDGVNDFVEIPDSPALHSDRGLTVSGWFKSDGFVREWQNVFFKGDLDDGSSPSGSNREYALWLNRAGFLRFHSTPANRVGVGNLTLDTPAIIQAGRWYHFAVVIDSDNQLMRLYVDGELKAEGAYDASGIRDTSGALTIGHSPPPGTVTSSARLMRSASTTRPAVRPRSRRTRTATSRSRSQPWRLTGTSAKRVGRPFSTRRATATTARSAATVRETIFPIASPVRPSPSTTARCASTETIPLAFPTVLRCIPTAG